MLSLSRTTNTSEEDHVTEEPRRGQPGLLRRTLHRLAADTQELDAQAMQKQTVGVGAQPVVRCGNREVATVYGVLRTVTLRPRAGVPSLEAQLYDGSGTVELVWLGRRRIGGIEPGRRLIATGRVAVHAGRRTIFNPAYELRAS